ncbi:hypothetical protein ACFLZ7_02795 [Nanoarchaeota archaeon]
MNQPLVTRHTITPTQLYKEILDPSVNYVLIGEDHFSGVHKSNERKILEKMLKSKRPCRLALENFEESHRPLFKAARTSSEKREELRRMIKPMTFPGKNGKPFELGKYHWAIIGLMFEYGKEVIPINPDEPKGDVLSRAERYARLARNLRSLKPNVLTVSIHGEANVSSEEFTGQLRIPERERRHVIQGNYLESLVYKNGKGDHVMFLNRCL